MRYRAEIDGLRALAVVPVILYHAGSGLFSGGFIGVDVFFVISGYLITTILIEDIHNDKFSLIGFYERRARRLLPALYTVVITSIITAYFVLVPGDLMFLAKAAISIPIFISNFFFWSERGYFGDPGALRPLIHTWSLAVEEQFYIIFPVVLLFLHRWGSKLLYLVLGTVFLVSLAASYYVTLLHFDTAFYFPITRAWELLMGAFCAFALRGKWLVASNPLCEIASIFGLLLIFYGYFFFDENTLFPYVNAMVPTLGTAFFILFSTNSPAARSILSFRPLVFIGLISYSLYLWHQPIFSFARHLHWFTGYQYLFIVGTFCLAVLTYFLIEKPFRNAKQISTRILITTSIAGTILIVSAGANILINKGFPSRYSAEDQNLLVQLATYQRYTVERFNALHTSPFSDEKSTKVVLIGDSHAKDFYNIIVESELFDDYQFSTLEINSECGNLLLPSYDDIQQFIPTISRERCSVLGRYESESFNQIAEKADEIWLVGFWLDWVVDYLPESLQNLDERFEKTVRIVGLKDFGEITVAGALEVPASARETHEQSIDEKISQTADKLDASMEDYPYYYPIMDDLCDGNRNECRVFNEDGLLISPDGGHLTREGAIEAASRLEDTLLRMRAGI